MNAQDLEIEYLPLSALRPYKYNARKHEKDDIEAIKQSIIDYGFNDPIGIWGKDNIIVEGHGRFIAAQELGKEFVPCIKLDHLTEEQRRGYAIAHNRTAELSKWEQELLNFEIGEINIDMSAFKLDIDIDCVIDTDAIDSQTPNEEDDGGYYGDERERTNKAYNLDLIDYTNLTNDFWQMPIIRNDNYIPGNLIGFNYAKSSERKDVGIHFYVDDYQFERVWNAPEKYVDILSDYECILSPDFSLYMDMPMPMKIWNIYRSRQIGAFYQSRGIKVIPTISWAERETFEFCFQGIPKGSIVSISTVGVKEDKNALKIWRDGVTAMIDQIEPSAILIYGGKLDFDYGDIKTFYYENKVTERWGKSDDA